jgi:Tol biopolymer transport system component
MGDERDPWLSPDGTEFYFASDRAGNHAIYVCEVTRSDD